MNRRLWAVSAPNVRPSVQTQGPSTSVNEPFGSTITRSSTAQERPALRADPVMPKLSSMLPFLEISSDPATRQEFAALLQTAAPATQHHFNVLLESRRITLPDPATDVPRLAAPPSVPQLGWHTPDKIPTPPADSAPAAPAAPAAGLAAKAGSFIALAERMTATGAPTAVMPRFLQELEAVADPPTDQATQTDFPDTPAAPAAGSAESAAAVANLTGMLQRFSLWEADWSTDDLHPLLERLEQLTAKAAAPPDTTVLLEQFEARFADLSKRLSDYQLSSRVIFRNIDGRFAGLDARLNDGDKRAEATDKRFDAADKQLTVLGSRAVEAQDAATVPSALRRPLRKNWKICRKSATTRKPDSARRTTSVLTCCSARTAALRGWTVVWTL
jgi:hypothetical protein